MVIVLLDPSVNPSCYFPVNPSGHFPVCGKGSSAEIWFSSEGGASAREISTISGKQSSVVFSPQKVFFSLSYRISSIGTRAFY